MNKTPLSLLLLLLAGMVMDVASDTGIIINKNLFRRSSSVRASLYQYINDLKTIEHRTLVVDSTSFDSTSDPKTIRSVIYNYKKSHPLDGVIFIGKIPWLYHVYQTESKSYDTVATDYYYMDLNNANPDSCWDVTVLPDTSGRRIINKKCSHNLNIWVSRILAPYGTIGEFPNNYPLYSDKYLGPNWNPDTIINRYLIKVHKRMTEPATVPRRALFTGFKTISGEIAQFPSSYPIVSYLYPASSAHTWMRELRKGYEFASVCEHSCWEHSNFGQNWGKYHTGCFCGYEPDKIVPPLKIDKADGQFATMDKMDTINYPPPFGGGPSHTLFFSSEGCSNVDFSKERCLGLMYGMMFDGLICMGATVEISDNREHFIFDLLKDSTFGAAYLGHANRNYGHIYTLIGAGTLKMSPYVENPMPVFPIDPATISIAPDNQIITEGDSVTLSVSGSGHIPPSSFHWYGNRDSAIGNPARFRVESQYPGNSYYTVHLDYPGAQPSSAVATIPFPWVFTTSQGSDDSSKWSYVTHDLKYDEWAACHLPDGPTWSTTLFSNYSVYTMDDDRYVHYHAAMPLNDNFEISALVDSITGDYPIGHDPNNPSYNDPSWSGCVGTGFRPDQNVMAGVMVRECQSTNPQSDDPYSFFGSLLNNSGNLMLVFIYREYKGGLVTIRSEGPWVFWALRRINYKISRIGSKLYVKATIPCYGWDDNNPVVFDSVDFGPKARNFCAGTAFLNGGPDNSVHSRYGARFTDIKTKITPHIPLELRMVSIGIDSAKCLAKAIFECVNRNTMDIKVPVGDSNKIYCGDNPNVPFYYPNKRSVFPPGSTLDTFYFWASKITWVLENNPPVVADLGRFPPYHALPATNVFWLSTGFISTAFLGIVMIRRRGQKDPV